MNLPAHPPRRDTLSIADGLVLGIIVAIGVSLSYRPLWHTDLWGHLAYGKLYAETGQFPSTEPFLSTSLTTPFVTTSWFAQWGGYHIHRVFGYRGLQLAYAFFVSGIFAVVFLSARKIAHHTLAATLSLICFTIVEYNQLLVIRPQLAGLFCFVLYLWSLQQRTGLVWKSCAVILLWANLHGSFLIGPVILSLMLIFRLLSFSWKQPWRGIRENRRTRQLLVALILGLLVSLCNPYGWLLHREVLGFSQSPNLASLLEWKPIWRTRQQGIRLAIVCLLAVFSIVLSRSRIRLALWLPVLLIATRLIFVSRFIVWFGPLFVLALAPHLRFWIFKKRSASTSGLNKPLPRPGLVIATLGVLALSGSSLAKSFFRGESLSPPSALGRKTPVAASEVLIEQHDEGIPFREGELLFNTMEWGDWLIWQSENRLPVFVNSHVTFIRPDVWRDYMTLIKLEDRWRDTWERYPFRVAIIDLRRHQKLASEIESLSGWSEVYRDAQSIVLARVRSE